MQIRRATIVGVAGVIVAGMLAGVPIAAAVAPVTGLSITSSGGATTWLSPDVSFSQPSDPDSESGVSALRLEQNVGYPYTPIWIAARQGELLAVGAYEGATNTGGDDPTLWINETGCSPQSGRFEILELATSGNTVTALAVRFEITCYGGTEVTVTGDYRYQSSLPLQGPHLTLDGDASSSFGEVKGGTATEARTVRLANGGTAAFDVDSVTLTGPDPDSFEVMSDTCAGITLAPGASCTVAVRATPSAAGGYESARLTFVGNTFRSTFGLGLYVTAMTAVSVAIQEPKAGPYSSTKISAKIDPVQPNTLAGSVAFYVGGEYRGLAWPDATGTAALSVQLQPGANTVRVDYTGPGCCSQPPAAPATDTATVTGLQPVNLSFSTGSSIVIEGTHVGLQVTFEANAAPSSGKLRLRDGIGGAILGETTFSTAQHTWYPDPVVLPVGAHQLVVEFIGPASFEAKTATTTVTWEEDTGVVASGLAVSPTTFYPVKDGYVDSIKIVGTTGELATVAIRIYNSAGTRVRAISLGTKYGSYATTWDGRTSGGTLLPAGTYKVRQYLRDGNGNTLFKDVAVKLSHRKVKWIATASTKYGASYAASAKDGTGSITTARSSFTNGVKFTGGSGDGVAVVRWKFTLKTALAYKGLSISVLGKGTRSTSRALLAFAQDSFGYVIGPSYKWWSARGTIRGHVNDRVVLLDVETDGPMSGAFDVAKARVTYTYAVWP